MARHPRNALSASQIRATTQPGLYADGLGLYLKVDEAGTKRWLQRVVVQGKRHHLGLGSWPGVSLKDAREVAVNNRALARTGRNPIHERKQQGMPTFAEAAERVMAFRRPTWRNAKHAAQWRATLATYAYPAIGHRLVGDITSGDILEVLTPIWTVKPETASRVRQRIRAVLDWCIAQGFRADNPAGDAISAVLPRVSKDVTHHRALAYSAVADTLRSMRRASASLATRLCFEFLVVTATRSGEVRHARWKEIDKEDRTWTIPAVRMKAQREHRVPLSDHALEVLVQARGLDNGSGLVFPAPRTGKALSDSTLSKMLRVLGEDAVPHGFRSSFRDWAAECTDTPHAVMEAALAHVVPNAVEAAYARSDLFDRRRDLMQQWADYLGEGAKILTLGHFVDEPRT